MTNSSALFKYHRRFRILVPALILLSGFVACTEAGEFTATLVRIFDGDSFLAKKSNGTEVEIRLFGIDAPERNQPWSRKSRDALRDLLQDTGFSVRTITIDTYERTIAVVTLPDGRQVNSAMVEAGQPPVELDYELNPLGVNRFHDTLSGPFSAHPKYDAATGELHAMTYQWPDLIDHVQYVEICPMGCGQRGGVGESLLRMIRKIYRADD